MIVDTDFPDHWKTRMLVALLGDDEAAPVYLLRLWAHCQKRKTDTFDSLPPAALKAISRYTGDAEDLEGALTQSGFTERDGDSVTFLGWAEYNSGLIANWENGRKGGRPRKETQAKPEHNPSKTHGLTQQEPIKNPSKTHGVTHQEPIGVDMMGLDGSRQDESGSDTKTGADKPRTDNDYPDEFETAWQKYPKRAGGNPKRKAYQAWRARVKSGVDPGDIQAGVERYASFVRTTGKENTEFVKQGATFFGPDEHYLEDWSPPAPDHQSKADRHSGFENREYTDHIPDWAEE